MLIAPELLNIHKGATWQLEFGIDKVQLNSLVITAFSPVLKMLGNANASFVMFEDRKEHCLVMGEHAFKGKEIDAFRNLLGQKRAYRSLSLQDNEPLLTALDEKCPDCEISVCCLSLISNPQEHINGYVCVYNDNFLVDEDTLQDLINLAKDSLISALLASKYKRLDRDREEFNELVANTNEHPIFAKDKESRLVFANRAFIDFYPPEKQDQIIGYTTVEDYPEDQRRLFLADDQEAFDKGEKKVTENIDFPSGERTVLETTKRHFKTSSGQDFILGVAYDLTQQYELIDILKKRNSDLDQVASMLATDVRAPANALVKLVRWLKEDLSDLGDADVTENLEEISKRANKLSKLLSAIHEYCFAGRDHQVKTSVSITELVSDILSGIVTTQDINTNIDDKLFSLPRGPVKRVLTELIRNAVEHNDKESVDIDIKCNEDQHFFYILVDDNNKTLPEEERKKVFRLFESSKIRNDDTVIGLGLAIARKIVESYKGTLTIGDLKANGNTFVVAWPKKGGKKVF